MFGSNKTVTRDSFFKITFDTVFNIMKKKFYFDNILIDVFKVTNEKFVLDYVSENNNKN